MPQAQKEQDMTAELRCADLGNRVLNQEAREAGCVSSDKREDHSTIPRAPTPPGIFLKRALCKWPKQDYKTPNVPAPADKKDSVGPLSFRTGTHAGLFGLNVPSETKPEHENPPPGTAPADAINK